VASPTGDDEGSNVLINSSGREEVGATTPSGKALVGLEKRKFRALPTWTAEGTTEPSSGLIQKVDLGEAGDSRGAGTESW